MRRKGSDMTCRLDCSRSTPTTDISLQTVAFKRSFGAYPPSTYMPITFYSSHKQTYWVCKTYKNNSYTPVRKSDRPFKISLLRMYPIYSIPVNTIRGFEIHCLCLSSRKKNTLSSSSATRLVQCMYSFVYRVTMVRSRYR